MKFSESMMTGLPGARFGDGTGLSYMGCWPVGLGVGMGVVAICGETAICGEGDDSMSTSTVGSLIVCRRKTFVSISKSIAG